MYQEYGRLPISIAIAILGSMIYFNFYIEISVIASLLLTGFLLGTLIPYSNRVIRLINDTILILVTLILSLGTHSWVFEGMRRVFFNGVCLALAGFLFVLSMGVRYNDK